MRVNKMKKRILDILIIGFLVSTFSCATPGVKRQANEKIYRFVRDNVLYSTSSPSLELSVNPQFQYVGEAKNTRNVQYKRGEGKATVHDHSFIFVEADENKRIRKAIVISFSTIDYGYILQNLFAGVEDYLDAGYVKINGENYQYNINASPTTLRNYETSFIVSKGYKVPNCILMKGLGKRASSDNRTKIHIFYIEDPKSEIEKKYQCQDWNNAKSLTNEQKIYINKFIARSNDSFQIKGSFALADRLKAFLFQYCQTYKEKDLDKLSAFFASDAIEKGRPIGYQLSKYRQSFEQIDAMDYLIELQDHSVQNETGIIRIEGEYHARAQLKKNGKWRRNNGDISMDLVASGDSFKIKRLDYFKSVNPETALKDQKLIKPQPTIQDAKDKDFQGHLNAFLDDYSRTYSEMNLNKFADFFTPDAIEKGKPFASRLNTYRDNFKQIDSIDYQIELKRHSIQKDTGLIRINGIFHAGVRLKNSGELKKISGEVSMDIIAAGDSFKIWRLDYFTRDVKEIALKTKKDTTRSSVDNPASPSPPAIQKNNHIAAGEPSKDMDRGKKNISTKKQPDNEEKYTIQVASSKDLKAADEMLSLLKGKGYPAYLTKVKLSGSTWYRIQTGDFESKHETHETLNRLQKDKFDGIIVKKDKESKDIPPKTTKVLQTPTSKSFQPLAGIDETKDTSSDQKASINFTDKHLKNRLEAFLFDYSQTYADKQLDKFSTFFAPDAIEKSKSFQSQIPKYRQYFATIDSLSYWIELKRYSIPQNTRIIQIEGSFNLQVQLKEGSKKWEYSSGDISMDLVASGDSFKIRRLDYYVR
jgi:3-phenylpropionate/cinnamic acid dioxygenase small subunit